jgi:hypothetical protein
MPAETRKPVADAYAIIDPENSRDKDAKANFVHIGSVWENQDKSLQVIMFAEPIAWRSPVHSPRKMQIRFRDDRNDRDNRDDSRDRRNDRRR